MASDPREAAKREITARDQEDPELGDAIEQGRVLSLEILRENNRHTADMRGKELGFVGKLIGGESTAPTVVALFVVVVGFGAAIGCWIAAAQIPDQAEFWSKQAERAIGFGSAALAFIFGKGAK